jgi:HEAT repeat protein
MTDTYIQQKAIEGLIQLHKVIKNVQLYPPGSPTIDTSIERIYLHFEDILRQDAPLVFAEAEKKALLRGKILNQKEQETIHVVTLLDILFGLGIKSISFDKGLEKAELHTFINLLAKKPETIFDEGGLPRLMAENKIAHIYLDNQIYVAVDKDKKNISTINVKDQKNISPANVAENRSHESIGEMNEAVHRLMEELFNENADTRIRASNELSGIIDSLSYDQQIFTIKKLSGRLVEWIKQETTATPAYRKTCSNLQKLIQNLISQENFTETIPLMEVFSNINTGTLQKNDKVREVSLAVLRNLASDDNINILLKEFSAAEQNKETEADRILAGFGDVILNKLLDMIKDVTDSTERVRIIHLIEGVGQRAIPGIKDRININAPWYYLRNLAYILGRIGNETTANILHPLLFHKNERVRMEALKSISQTAGNQRGPLLLSVLPQADDQLRINIIEMLGKIKYAKAVTNLLDILKNKSSIANIPLQEKVCNALGSIGSPEAIPALSELAESKSFLGIRSYPVEVKYAAKRALASIKRKQEEDAKI